MRLQAEERTRLKKMVDEHRRILNARSQGRAVKSYHANREMCAGWSVATSAPCQIFAKPGSRFCRYHDAD